MSVKVISGTFSKIPSPNAQPVSEPRQGTAQTYQSDQATQPAQTYQQKPFQMSQQAPSNTQRVFGQELPAVNDQSVLDWGSIPRLAIRGAESAAGVPHNIARTAQSIANIPSSIRRDIQERLNMPKEDLAYGERVPLPSQQQLRENVTEPITKLITGSTEALKPASEFEDQLGDITETAAQRLVPALFLPGAGLAHQAGSALLTAGAGQLAKEAAKSIGYGEQGAEVAKVGTMLGLELLGPVVFGGQKSIDTTIKDLMGKEKLLDESGDLTNARPIKTQLTKQMEKIRKSYGANSAEAQWYQDFKSNIEGDITLANTIPVRRLVGERSKYNSTTNFKKVPDLIKKSGPDGYVGSVWKSFEEAVNDAPFETQKLFHDIELGRSMSKAQKAQSWIQKKIENNKDSLKYLKKVGGLGSLGLGYKFMHNPSALLGKAGLGAAAYGAGKLGVSALDKGWRLLNEPGFAHWYSKAAQNIAQNNIPAATKYVAKIGKKIEPLLKESESKTEPRRRIELPKKPRMSSSNVKVVSGTFRPI